MHLIIGLGNPGEKYLKSRHNAGFILLDEIVGDNWDDDKYGKALVFRGKISEHEALFVKPMTFMNNSGVSVKTLREKYAVDPENIVVIHDDIDMPFDSIKVVFERGDGGHNGIKSITNSLNTNKFIRIKIGIAPIGENGEATKPKAGFFTSQKSAVSRYVLKDFSKGDLERLKFSAPKTKEILETIVKEGYLKAMNKFN
jgi:PTH1 family peptidyl-tRNA hydrolase